MKQELPSLERSHRPAHAYRIWRAMRDQVDAAGQPVALRRALGMHRWHPAPATEQRLSDSGHLVDASVSAVIRRLWPGFTATDANKYDPDDPIARHSYHFGQAMTAQLRGSFNAICLRRGNPARSSVWWLRDEWLDDQPTRSTIMTPFGPDDPDVPEGELVRLQEQNQTLRAENERLRKELHRMHVILHAVSA